MIVGIDLGTTNSAIAIWRDGTPELIPNRLGHLLTPSAVSLDTNGTVIVGLPARERQVSHPKRTASAFKRYMGTKHSITLGTQKFTPEELSSLVLRSLIEDAETYLGEKITEAVITVPAYYNDKQRKATRRAGQLAGLSVERLINEPTAAALAYSIHELENESRFLVFDLGGGTFDVSVLEIFEGVIEVRSSTGDNRLGGEDFNTILVRMLQRNFKPAIGKDILEDHALIEKLRDQAERMRRTLSEETTASARFTWKENEYEISVSQDEFEEECSELLSRMREPVIRSLRDSNIAADMLSEIILIGGTTRMPLVRKAVTKMFGRFPNISVNPDEAVAIGAAIQAGLKARDEALDELVLTDVCPFSLGVESSHYENQKQIDRGLFSPIIERNTIIPTSRVESFSTVFDYQEQITFNIYQGEARRVEDNVKLGAITVPVPRKRSGQSVNVRFTYDINGLLEVDIHVPESDKRFQLLINDEDYDPASLAKRRDMLEKLKVHPRDTEVIRAIMARANRCWENALGDDRDYLSMQIGNFEKVLHKQDQKSSLAFGEELSALLDRIEGKTFL